MDSLKAPNFIPPWATSLLGGNRKEGAFPSKEAVSHNDNVRTDGAGLNPKLSVKQCVRTASVYPVNSSEAPNDTDGSDTDGSDEVDDNDDEDDEDDDDDNDEGEDNDDGPLATRTQLRRPRSANARCLVQKPALQATEMAKLRLCMAVTTPAP
ncbi:hypothetical protein HYQ46_012878 [Verticillium longisporum]|nr:hypothetical protein HYQ46_012878 [Verticillium longisporum]